MAFRELTGRIVEVVHSVLEKTPPELAEDVAQRGIVLTGGGSLIDGLEDLLEGQGARQEALLDEIERSIREATKAAQKSRFGLFK